MRDENEIEWPLMAYSPCLRAILERSRQPFREGQWLSEEEFWSQLEHTQPSKPKKRAERSGAPGQGRRPGSARQPGVAGGYGR